MAEPTSVNDQITDSVTQSNVKVVGESRAKPKAVQVILCGGLVAGTLDLTAACISSWFRAGVGPVQVMQSVASGLLGAASYTGGARTAALGVALHFLIATVATAVFYFASRKLRFLVEQAVTAGLLYGVAVYLFMNFVVLPLSALPQRAAPPLSGRIIGLLVIMFCIGLPIAVIVRWFSRPHRGLAS
jgi:Killing trait